VCNYDWPGNVRELRNTIEGMIVLSLKETLELSDLPDHIREAKAKAAQTVFQPGMTIEDMEREAIRRTLEMTTGHRGESARRLGLSVRTLQRKMNQYGLRGDYSR
jgi:DNA-binding NtrC family response regulator